MIGPDGRADHARGGGSLRKALAFDGYAGNVRLERVKQLRFEFLERVHRARGEGVAMPPAVKKLAVQTRA